MAKYTINYRYGQYSGNREVVANSEEEAIARMWRDLKPYMVLSMATKHAEVIEIDNDDE